jgi:hypothetical protein
VEAYPNEMVEVAVEYREPELPEMRPDREPSVGRVVKVLLPLQVLVSPRRVVEAIVMSAVPLKETPLMRRGVWRAVAVPALPPMEREEVAASRSAVPAEFE